MRRPRNFFVGVGTAWLSWDKRTVCVFGPPWPHEGDPLYALMQSGRIARFLFTEKIDDGPAPPNAVFAEVEDDRWIPKHEFMSKFGRVHWMNDTEEKQ